MNRNDRPVWNEIRKWLITIIEIALIVGVVWAVIVGIQGISFAEGDYAKGYVICQPGDYVNARISPSRKSESVGRYESADVVWLDGETKNGFALCVNAMKETDDVWVYTGYIVFDEPKWLNGQTAIVSSTGRLAARRNCCGEVRKWLTNGTEMQVFWWSDDWCVTNYGFVKTQYIDLVGE